jgi:fatty acid desaturase
MAGVPMHTEWRTVAVAVCVYGGLLATIAWQDRMGPVAAVAVLSVLGCWFLSLQHECIHGHPFRNARWNARLAAVPLNLALPYAVYRDSHLQHHRNAVLTEPGIDPESHYLRGADWAAASGVRRALLTVNQTLAGRMLLHPLRSLVRTIVALPHDLKDAKSRAMWARHLLGAAVVLLVIDRVAGLAAWEFLLGFSYGGASLTAIRGFAEHRWTRPGLTRSATVDAAMPWRLLFLNNNFHHAHHAQPTVAWHLLPELSRRTDAAAASARGAGAYRGYGEVFRRYFLRPFAPVVHPAHQERCCVAAPRCSCTLSRA